MSGEAPKPNQPDVPAADIEAALNAAHADQPANVDAPDASAAVEPRADASTPVETPPQSLGEPDSGLPQTEIGDSATASADNLDAGMEALPPDAAATIAGLPAMSLDLPSFAGASSSASEHKINLLGDVELDVKIELGRASMLIEDVLRLGEGSVVELDKLAGDPVDIRVNGRLVARGEVLVLNDNFCVRISEIVSGGEAEAA